MSLIVVVANHRLVTLIISLYCIFLCDEAYADIRREKYHSLSLTHSGSNESVHKNELQMTDKVDGKIPTENADNMGTKKEGNGTPDGIQNSSGLKNPKYILNFP